MARKKIDNDMEHKACQLSNGHIDSTVQTETTSVEKKRKTRKDASVDKTSTNADNMSEQEKDAMRKRGEEALKAAFQELQQQDREKETVALTSKRQTETTKEIVPSESAEVTEPKKTRRKKSASDVNLANYENTVQNDSIKQVEEKVEDTTRANSQMLPAVYERRGELVDYNGEQFIILESDKDGFLVISSRIIKEMPFDDSMKNNTNNWKTSKVRSWLNNTYVSNLNKEDLLPITSSLIADTGEKDRGTSEDLVAIPTDDIFRKYYDTIPTYDNWVWSATPWAIEVGEGKYQSARSNNKCLYSLATYERIGVVTLVKFKPTAI